MSHDRVIHVITPGDHYSPRTGSALPTVVHLLADAALHAGDAPHAVVLDRATYSPRYGGVELIEYDRAPWMTRRDRYVDAVAGRLGLPRPRVSRWYRPAADAIGDMPPANILAHNAPFLPWLLRDSEHQVAVYAHNQLFRTYGRREAARVAGEASVVICVSEALAAETRALLPRSLHPRIQVVQNPVDTRRFTPAAGQRDADGPLRVLFVGRMVRQKGAHVLIAAAAAFSADEVEVSIIGSAGFDPNAPLSAYEHSLREVARNKSVAFLPFTDRDSLPDLYRAADVLVVPSIWAEPSGLTVAEGMASGLPVVASHVGGIPEVLGDTGILIPPDDPDALARALRTLHDDPALRASLGVTARQRAVKRDAAQAWESLRTVLGGL